MKRFEIGYKKVSAQAGDTNTFVLMLLHHAFLSLQTLDPGI